MFRVELTEAAVVQAEAANGWWRANRDSPELFEIELANAVALLARMPPPTKVWAEINGQPVRKVRFPKTQHALYFTVVDDLVTVHAVWHGTRGSEPPLK